VLFRDLDVMVTRGERWGVIGPNGAGKTTLVRAILGELTLSTGQTKIGFNVAPGYFKQLADGEIPAELKVYEYLQSIIRRELPGKPMSEQVARDLAGAFLFSGEDQNKLISVMSGGEKSRARLAGLLASAKNLLVLDEPTNHLDIPSAERLEEALRSSEKGGAFDGTLILISHDRALIDATCDHLLVLDGKGNVTVFLGNYTDWVRKQKEAVGQPARGTWAALPGKPGGGGSGGSGKGKPAQAKKGLGSNSQPAPEPVGVATKPAPSGGGSANGGSSKKKSTGGKFSWMPTDRLETEIAAATAKLKKMDDELASEEVYRDVKRFQKLLKDREPAAAELAGLEEEWLKRAE